MIKISTRVFLDIETKYFSFYTSAHRYSNYGKYIPKKRHTNNTWYQDSTLSFTDRHGDHLSSLSQGTLIYAICAMMQFFHCIVICNQNQRIFNLWYNMPNAHTKENITKLQS